MADTPAPERLIELERSCNFRDLGGYVGADGRRVRWRRLFRSDGLHNLTEADLAKLVSLGLRTVIDMRTGDELERMGRIAWPNEELRFHHCSLMDVLPPPETYREDGVNPVKVAEQYEGILAEGSEAIGVAIDVLCDPDAYPLVYHCLVGKDRTGILSAIVLSALGVGRPDIVADYALSGDAMVRLMDWVAANEPVLAQTLEPIMPAILLAAPETMERFLGHLDERYGGAEGYLRFLGRPEAGARLRELLLEP